MESSVDPSVQSTIVTGMSQEATGASTSRVRRWDQLAADTATMWAGYLTTPTVLAGQGIRMLNGTPTTAPLQAPGAQAKPE